MRNAGSSELVSGGASSPGRDEGTVRLTVLLVVPQPFFEVRGSPLNVLQMCRALTMDGHEVHLACYGLGEDVDMPGLTVHRCVRIPGIRQVPIGYSKRKVILDLALALTVWRLLLQHRFSVIHAIEEAVFFCLPAARLQDIPLIYDLDSCISDQLAYSGVVSNRVLLRGIRSMERWALRHATCAVTVCQALTDFVRALSPATAVYQVEDTPLLTSSREPGADDVARLRRSLGVTGRRVLVYTGNLEGYQGIDLLLEAIPLVLREHSDATFVIVGGAPEEVTALRRRVTEAGIARSVRLPGRCAPELIPQYLGLADALLSPRTKGQNTPLKIYTYMYSGRPTVATDLPTHTQVLDASRAVLVPPTPEGFARGIVTVLDDPEYGGRLARAAREVVQREYSFDAFRSKLNQAYQCVTQPDRAPTSRRSLTAVTDR
jgi:glycosyltransferase involved in cell wall biosynthesis